ncbi:MAG: YopX family protein [Pseudomonadota bacterium]
MSKAMREIKFRAWHTIRKCMIPPDYSPPFMYPKDYPYDYPDTFSISADGSVSELNIEDGTHLVGDRIVLMQYTGLKDKNGKEIYEGDIVKVQFNGWSEVQPITWERSGWSAQDPWNTLDFPHQERLEVIGNIYENPELIQPDGQKEK